MRKRYFGEKDTKLKNFLIFVTNTTIRPSAVVVRGDFNNNIKKVLRPQERQNSMFFQIELSSAPTVKFVYQDDPIGRTLTQKLSHDPVIRTHVCL